MINMNNVTNNSYCISKNTVFDSYDNKIENNKKLFDFILERSKINRMIEPSETLDYYVDNRGNNNDKLFNIKEFNQVDENKIEKIMKILSKYSN